MSKKIDRSVAKTIIVLIVPPVFMLAAFVFIFIFVSSIRSFDDLRDFQNQLAVCLAVASVSVLLIRTTGIAVKKVLIGWFTEGFNVIG